MGETGGGEVDSVKTYHEIFLSPLLQLLKM